MKIAGVCAYSSSHNTGMLSVDLSLVNLIKNLPGDNVLDLFTVEKAHEVPSRSRVLLSYNHLTSLNQLADYDRILFWGDFLHARPYHVRDIGNRRPQVEWGLDRTEDEIVFPLLLLETASDEILKKTICFGGSLYINSARDELNERYSAALRRLFSLSRLALFRDPISAYYGLQYSNRPDNTAGVDAAFLLKPIAKRLRKSGVLYSFGRGPSRDPVQKARLKELSEKIAGKLGQSSTSDLSWLNRDKEDPVAGFEKKIREIKGAKLVVTDTYHCAVNCWREGTPAICIGNGSEKPGRTLSDKKKELLYLMFNIKDFYVFSESLTDDLDGIAKTLASVVENRPAVERAFNNVRVASERSKALVLSALAEGPNAWAYRQPSHVIAAARGTAATKLLAALSHRVAIVRKHLRLR